MEYVKMYRLQILKGLGYSMAHWLGLADIHPLFYMISILDYMIGDLLEAKLFRKAFSHKIAWVFFMGLLVVYQYWIDSLYTAFVLG